MAVEVNIKDVQHIITLSEIQGGVVTIAEKELIVVVEQKVEIVTIGTQGPPGPPGLPGSSASGETVTAAIALLAQRAVVLNSTGKAIYASADTPGHAGRVVGITTNAASIDQQVSVKTSGIITEAGWTWIPEKLIFLGLNGNLTQTPPLTGIGFTQILGTSITATSMMVRLHKPTVRP